MTELLFLAVVALGIVGIVQSQKLRSLTRRIERLERDQALAHPASEPAPLAAQVR